METYLDERLTLAVDGGGEREVLVYALADEDDLEYREEDGCWVYDPAESDPYARPFWAAAAKLTKT